MRKYNYQTSQKFIRSRFESLSKKDLTEVHRLVDRKMQTLKPQKVQKTFENYVKNETYIPYTTHLRGVSHHIKRGPCRRPIKTYKYVVNALKGLKSTFEFLEKNGFEYKQLMINSSGFKPGGVIRHARGAAYRKKIKHHALVFVYSKKQELKE